MTRAELLELIQEAWDNVHDMDTPAIRYAESILDAIEKGYVLVPKSECPRLKAFLETDPEGSWHRMLDAIEAEAAAKEPASC